MKAVILIGGMGTRLRPFTLQTPKPLMPVLNRPFLEYQLQVLKRAGIKDIVLCVAYRPEVFHRVLGDGRALGLRISYARERLPLGTGGALKNAEPFLSGTTLVLNGDVLNALDIADFRRFHEARRAEITIALTRVKDPTAYGLVLTDDKGHVKKFVEKPAWDDITTNTINAGAYLFEPSVFSHIPSGKPYSLERGLFPERLSAGARIAGYVAGGYWIDIGTLAMYLQVHLDVMEGKTPFKLDERARLFKNSDGARVFAGPGSHADEFARFSGSVSLGAGVRIGRGASLTDCVVLDKAVIGAGARLERCVIGAGARIGTHATMGPGTALAGASRVGDFSQL